MVETVREASVGSTCEKGISLNWLAFAYLGLAFKVNINDLAESHMLGMVSAHKGRVLTMELKFSPPIASFRV